MSTTTLILGLVSLVSGIGPYVPKMLSWFETSTSMEDLMVAEYRALYTLRRRAERRKCEALKTAVESVEQAFMGGDDPTT